MKIFESHVGKKILLSSVDAAAKPNEEQVTVIEGVRE